LHGSEDATAHAIARRSYSPIVMASMPKNSARCVGLRSICAMVASCKQSERTDRERASTTRTRTKSAAPTVRQEPLRVHHRGRHASDNSLVSADGSTNRGSRQASFPCSPAHVASFDGGYKLANDGHDTPSLAHYLGHRNLQSTARYTALAPDRFARFWKD
jgi:hypothetical protein